MGIELGCVEPENVAKHRLILHEPPAGNARRVSPSQMRSATSRKYAADPGVSSSGHRSISPVLVTSMLATPAHGALSASSISERRSSSSSTEIASA